MAILFFLVQRHKMQIKVPVCRVQPLRKGRFVRDSINVRMFPVKGGIAFSVT